MKIQQDDEFVLRKYLEEMITTDEHHELAKMVDANEGSSRLCES